MNYYYDDYSRDQLIDIINTLYDTTNNNSFVDNMYILIEKYKFYDKICHYLIVYIDWYELEFNEVKTLFEAGVFSIEYERTDDHWIKKLMKWQLTSYCENRVTKLLVKYGVFKGCIFNDYYDIVCSEYETENEMDHSLSELFSNSISDNSGDIYKMMFQIKHSNINNMKEIEIYLDPDFDCSLTILNYVVTYCENVNKMHIINILLKYGFSDEETCNRYRRGRYRTLTALETACAYGDVEVMEILCKKQTDDFVDNVNTVIDKLFMARNPNENVLKCTELMLTAKFTEENYNVICDLLDKKIKNNSTTNEDYRYHDKTIKIFQKIISKRDRKYLADALRNNTLKRISNEKCNSNSVYRTLGMKELEFCISEFL